MIHLRTEYPPNELRSNNKIERLAIHTDLARLSRLCWFLRVFIEENLIYGTPPKTPSDPPETPGRSGTLIATFEYLKIRRGNVSAQNRPHGIFFGKSSF